MLLIYVLVQQWINISNYFMNVTLNMYDYEILYGRSNIYDVYLV